jgi:ADP-heptose:LPS heptosyltransferase
MAQLLRSVAERGISVSRKPEAIVIHPGSGSPAKNWPLQRYVELIRRLKADEHVVRVTIGESERQRWSTGEIAELAEVADLRQPANYLELLEALSAAHVLITNDSGPGHLAGIIGVPTLSLFGPTDPAVWRPAGPRVVTLRAQPIESLPLERVAAQVAAMMKD